MWTETCKRGGAVAAQKSWSFVSSLRHSYFSSNWPKLKLRNYLSKFSSLHVESQLFLLVEREAQFPLDLHVAVAERQLHRRHARRVDPIDPCPVRD